MEEVNKFHEQRIAFAIVNGRVQYLKNSKLSHIGWLVGGGIVTAEEFVHLTRGYYKDGVLAFYSGNFEGNALVERDIFNYLDTIKDELDIEDLKSIYCGVLAGERGKLWQPIKEIRIAKSCGNETWNNMGALERVECTEKYLDAVWNNDILLNFRLLRDGHKSKVIRLQTLEDLKVFKGRLVNTWHEDEPVYLEKINNCIDRIEYVLEILEIFVEK